jgi:hypothetical protein
VRRTRRPLPVRRTARAGRAGRGVSRGPDALRVRGRRYRIGALLALCLVAVLSGAAHSPRSPGMPPTPATRSAPSWPSARQGQRLHARPDASRHRRRHAGRRRRCLARSSRHRSRPGREHPGRVGRGRQERARLTHRRGHGAPAGRRFARCSGSRAACFGSRYSLLDRTAPSGTDAAKSGAWRRARSRQDCCSHRASRCIGLEGLLTGVMGGRPASAVWPRWWL